mgnify:CR=1 FL=1
MAKAANEGRLRSFLKQHGQPVDRPRPPQQQPQIAEQLHRLDAKLRRRSIGPQADHIEQDARQRVGSLRIKTLLVVLALPAPIPERVDAVVKQQIQELALLRLLFVFEQDLVSVRAGQG